MDERIVRKNLIRKRRKIDKYKRRTRFLLIVILVALFLVFVLDRFVVSVLTVEGNSMRESLHEGDKLLVQKMNLKSDNLRRDDIIYFIGNDDRMYLKRIIGEPGDVVEVINNKVFVNGIQKIEDYTRGEDTETYSQNKWFIKDDEFFVLGDNRLRNSSKDSRIFGPVNIKNIKGKILHNFSSER